MSSSGLTAQGSPFYGEPIPDLAFVQLGVRELPVLMFNAEPNAIRVGVPVAFAGFPYGSEGFLLRLEEQEPIVVQMMPFLRHGISSVFPFPCPQPHGFTIDVMSHGGASGTPIFGLDEPSVLGILYAAVEGEERLTYALPGRLLRWAVDAALSDGTLDIRDVPSFSDYRLSGRPLGGWMDWRQT